MWKGPVVLILSAVSVLASARDLRAQSGSGGADVCITIDDARDMLAPQDRTGAVRVLTAQFESAGRSVVEAGCAAEYTVSHVRLGDTIFVTLSAGQTTREGTALGLDDLPALYSQMVRSILSGRPMIGFNVIDRTNVTAVQASTRRVEGDRYGYARLGYGGVFGQRTYGAPALGFGYRVELDSFGVDVSFLNLQMAGRTDRTPGGSVAGSVLRLQGLYFFSPSANASTYVGGGVSWGGTRFGGDASSPSPASFSSDWHGRGLQGEITAGYELPRASTLRVFFEASGTLPFYRVAQETYTYSRTGATTTVARRYAASIVASVGIGWQRRQN